MPPSLRDWLAEDHLSYFISDAVDAMDLSAFEQRYGTDGPGNQAYDPRMMVKVLIYGYATGVFSSRKIAAKLTDDVAFRMLGAENFPAHRTISDFRKLHLEEFGNLFVQVVMMAREAGLVKMGTVAVDGTKMRANAGKRKAMSYERMKKQETELGEQIRDLLNRATATDEDEDQRYGSDRRGDELPDGLSTRKKRLATIQAAMKRLEDRSDGRGPGSGPERGRSQARMRKEAIQTSDGRTQADGPEQLHRSGKPDHEDLYRRFPAMLQRAGGGGFRGPDHRGDNGERQCLGRGAVETQPGCAERQSGRASRPRPGRCGISIRVESGDVGTT